MAKAFTKQIDNMKHFTKQAESLIVALNNDATQVNTKLRKIHTEMYCLNPDVQEITKTLNNLAETLADMKKSVCKLLLNIEEVKK